MDWERCVIRLLGGLVVLLTALTVLLGASALSTALGDTLGAQILNRVALACFLLVVVDAVLLLMVVAVRSLNKPPD